MNTTAKLALCVGFTILVTVGCASGPNGSDGVTSAPGGQPRTVTFSMSINPAGQIDRTGEGYYIFLMNANDQPIDVTDLDTFTDLVRFDGTNFQWYHRVEESPSPGFFLAFTSNINDNGSVSGDQTSLQVTFNTADASNPFNQFITTNNFTAHALTTNSLAGAIVGQVIDAYGPGPSIDDNEAFTVTASKLQGAIDPLPVNFPNDPLNDFIVYSTMPSNFPYENFDIQTFDITAQ